MPGTDTTNAAVPTPIDYLYFNFPGRGEATRILLNYGNIPHTETRIAWDSSPTSEWSTVKTKTPCGALPVLTVAGTKLSQQGSIERYVARLIGLYPEDPLQAAKVDMVASYLYELMDKTETYFGTPAEERPAFVEKLKENVLKPHFQNLSEMLGGNDYFVGNKLTNADITAFSWVSLYSSSFIKELPADYIHQWPNLIAHHDRVSALPGIQALYKDVTEGLLLAYAKPLAK